MELIFNLVIFIITLMALLLSMSIVWQTEKGLDEAFKIMTVALIIFGGMVFLSILDLLGADNLSRFNNYLLVAFILVMTFSLFAMERTIKKVWSKKRK